MLWYLLFRLCFTEWWLLNQIQVIFFLSFVFIVLCVRIWLLGFSSAFPSIEDYYEQCRKGGRSYTRHPCGELECLLYHPCQPFLTSGVKQNQTNQIKEWNLRRGPVRNQSKHVNNFKCMKPRLVQSRLFLLACARDWLKMWRQSFRLITAPQYRPFWSITSSTHGHRFTQCVVVSLAVRAVKHQNLR